MSSLLAGLYQLWKALGAQVASEVGQRVLGSSRRLGQALHWPNAQILQAEAAFALAKQPVFVDDIGKVSKF